MRGPRCCTTEPHGAAANGLPGVSGPVHPYVRAFHVKDAEYRATGRAGVYGGYAGWIERPGRFRTAGMGQVEFGAIFAKLAQYNYPGWAVLEWEDPLQCAEDGARMGARLIAEQIVRVTDRRLMISRLRPGMREWSGECLGCSRSESLVMGGSIRPAAAVSVRVGCPRCGLPLAG